MKTNKKSKDEAAVLNPVDDIVINRCSHCGKSIGNRWEEGWPMYGNITLGIDCCSLEYLWSKEKQNEERLEFNHPAMIGSGYQEINIQWGNGHKFDSKGRGYRICWHCQRKLIRQIGTFFENDICVGGEGL